MVSLRINGIDFTQYIEEDSYSVYSTSIVEEWEDADILLHESEYRKRIEGSFEMVFISDTDYNSFINNMVLATHERLTTMEVYVGGLTNQIVEGNFFCKVKSTSKRDAKAERVVNRLSVEIKEQ